MATKFPDIPSIVEKQTSGAQRITTWLALLALIVLAAEIILIIALFVTPKTSTIYNWFVPIILLFLLIFVAAYFFERFLASRSTEFLSFAKIEKLVKGNWFEFVYNNENIAFSVSEINFDSNQMQFVLHGVAYNEDAKKIANWKSIACAVTNLSVPEFRYFWEGERFSKSDSDNTLSGIGIIKFPPVETGQPFSEGEGWYSSGNISELKITGRYKINFVKLTKSENDKLKTDDQKWLKERYQKWKDSYVSD